MILLLGPYRLDWCFYPSWSSLGLQSWWRYIGWLRPHSQAGYSHSPELEFTIAPFVLISSVHVQLVELVIFFCRFFFNW